MTGFSYSTGCSSCLSIGATSLLEENLLSVKGAFRGARWKKVEDSRRGLRETRRARRAAAVNRPRRPRGGERLDEGLERLRSFEVAKPALRRRQPPDGRLPSEPGGARGGRR